MPHGRGWVKRGLVGLAVVVVVAGAAAYLNRADLRVRYAAYQLARAATDDDRAAWAARLAALGDAARPALVRFVATGDGAVRAAVLPLVEQELTEAADGDPAAAALADALLDGFPGCDTAGQEAVAGLLPALVKRAGPAGAAKCRAATLAGLGLPSPAARTASVRAAMHPLVKLRAEVVPLLNAPEAEVRRAALFAVGPVADGDPVIGDEELFRHLHDPDAGVRRGCQDALGSRGRTDADIRLARRLTHPDPAERLELLLDLRTDDDIPDPEPWLERLARDTDPGVRAGAARVAAEVSAARRHSPPPWLDRLADADPEPTVRRVAGFYRAGPTPRLDAQVRPAAGP